jgi:hypothetical protein
LTLAHFQAVLSHVTKMIHVDPLDKHSWFLFAAASYSQCLISAAPAVQARSTDSVLRHVLGLHAEEKARLAQALELLHKTRKDAAKAQQPGKERDDEAGLVREMRDVEAKLFFLRLAISDCCLLQGGEQRVAEALQLANEASASFTGTCALYHVVRWCACVCVCVCSCVRACGGACACACRADSFVFEC